MSESKQYLQHELILEINSEYSETLALVTVQDEESGAVRTHEVSKELLPYIITESPIDPTELQQRTLEPMVKEILTVFLRYSPRIDDIRKALQQAGDTLLRNIEIADDVKYGIPYLDRRVHLYHNILLEQDKKEIPSGK